MFKLRLEHSSKLHLSKQTMKRSTNYALLDEPWDRHTGTDTTWLLRPSWDKHTETNTLQRQPSPLRIRSRHLNSLWSSLSEHISTDSWRHQSHVTLLLKVAVSQCTHISHVVPEQLVVTSAGAPQIICDSTLPWKRKLFHINHYSLNSNVAAGYNQ